MFSLAKQKVRKYHKLNKNYDKMKNKNFSKITRFYILAMI